MQNPKKTEDMTEYMRNYYLNNNEKFTTKIECPECGYNYSKSNKTHHMNSKIHKLKNLEKKYNDLKKKVEEIKIFN